MELIAAALVILAFSAMMIAAWNRQRAEDQYLAEASAYAGRFDKSRPDPEQDMIAIPGIPMRMVTRDFHERIAR